MKKAMLVIAVVLGAISVNAGDFFWSTWNDDSVKGKNVNGCVLGLASDVKSVQGAQVSLVMNKADEVKSGCQWALFRNAAKTLRNGVQLAFIYNTSEASALQLGIVCHNEKGFLPWFVFFNFAPAQFGKAK